MVSRAAPFSVPGIDVQMTLAGQPEVIGETYHQLVELLRGELVISAMPAEWRELVAGVSRHAHSLRQRTFFNAGIPDPMIGFPVRCVDDCIETWQHPLPEPGQYELGICGLAGLPVCGGIVDRLSDIRPFDSQEAGGLLAARGFEGSTPLMLALLMCPPFIEMQGQWMSRPMPERCWRDPQSGQLFAPYCAYEENRHDGRLQDVHWKLTLGWADHVYGGNLRLVGFRRKP